MDALELSDIDLERELTPSQKLAQALEMMDVGLRLKKQTLARENPNATTTELDAIYLTWLLADD